MNHIFSTTINQLLKNVLIVYNYGIMTLINWASLQLNIFSCYLLIFALTQQSKSEPSSDLAFMTLQSRSEPSSDLAIMLSHSPNDITCATMNRVWVAWNIKSWLICVTTFFRNKNRFPGSDEYEAFGISKMSWECQTWCISKFEIKYASQGI